jgi:DNA mismatch repair protein MutS
MTQDKQIIKNYLRKIPVSNKTAIEDYFDLQREFEEKFGEKTIILYENGHFFEFYQIQNENEKVGRATEVADLLNMQLSKKDKSIPEVSLKNPQMAGFPSLALQRHMPLIMENGWTVVLVEQITIPPKPERAITGIYSKATYIEDTETKTDNYIMSIFLSQENYKNRVYYLGGWSIIDPSTGKIKMYDIPIQMNNAEQDYYYVFEELNRIITAIVPTEIVVNIDELKDGIVVEKMTEEQLRQQFSLPIKTNIHITTQVAPDYKKLVYQNRLFGDTFKLRGQITPIELLDLENWTFARMSLVNLLHFCKEHNPQLLNNIEQPVKWTSDYYVRLENNTLEQLDIISGRQNNLVNLIDNNCTKMGKRLLIENICAPIYNIDKLNERYGKVENYLVNKSWLQFDQLLKGIIDLERLHRKIQIGGMINPYELSNLYWSYRRICEIIEILNKKENKIQNPINSVKWEEATVKFNELIGKIETTFNKDELSKYSLKNITGGIFNSGIIDELDKTIQKRDSKYATLYELSRFISQKCFNDNESIRVEKMETDGFYLKTTVKKGEAVMKELKTYKAPIKVNDYEFNLKNMTVDTRVKSCAKILSDEIRNISEEYQRLDAKIIQLSTMYFNQYVSEIFSGYYKELGVITSFVGWIDYYNGFAKLAHKQKYVRPVIKDGKSYVSAKEMRHPIVEMINTTEPFISNDVSLGVEGGHKGMLLFGINGIGKSIYLKSVAINVILAQIGSFVAADSFEFSPFRSIMTRILSNDNLYKGYSSFMVEMIELKRIMEVADEYSLALADELTHGTETESGTSIMAATILTLLDSKTTFLMTTHLHQLTKLEEIAGNPDIKMAHMSVVYDDKTDKMIYVRRVEDGPGMPIYGIECCKGLHLNPKFIKRAQSIRNHLVNSEIKSPKLSEYNKAVLVDKCSVCGGTNDLHTHHIQEQHLADKDGMIGKINKDVAHNLVVLCEDCHHKVHGNKMEITGWQKTNEGMELKVKTDVEQKKTGKKVSPEIRDIILSKMGQKAKDIKNYLLMECKVDISETTIRNILKK